LNRDLAKSHAVELVWENQTPSQVAVQDKRNA